MNYNKIAICIPSYNCSAFIEETIAVLFTALKEINTKIPVFIFDDASNDKSVDIIKNVKKKNDYNLQVLVSKKNQGEAQNVNNAFQFLELKGYQWAILLHQDDFINPKWMSILIKKAIGQPSSIGLLCSANLYFEKEKCNKSSVFASFEDPKTYDVEIFPKGKNSVRRLEKEWFWNVSGSCIRIKTSNMIGGWHPKIRYAGDNDFLVRFISEGAGVMYFSYPGIIKTFHHRSATCSTTQSGEYSLGWSHLMHRHLQFSSKTQRILSLFKKITRETPRNVYSALKSKDLKKVKGQIFACFVFLRCLFAFLPGLAWVNHKLVKNALSFKFEPLQPENKYL